MGNKIITSTNIWRKRGKLRGLEALLNSRINLLSLRHFTTLTSKAPKQRSCLTETLSTKGFSLQERQAPLSAQLGQQRASLFLPPDSQVSTR